MPGLSYAFLVLVRRCQGRFSLPILEGMKGLLRVTLYTYSGDYKNCPRLEKLLKTEDRGRDIETNVIKLEANMDFKDLKLTFPFRIAKKPKIRSSQIKRIKDGWILEVK